MNRLISGNLKLNDAFAAALVIKQKPVITSASKIQSTQKKLDDRGFVENIMERYENEWKNGMNTKTISADMFIPKEALQ